MQGRRKMFYARGGPLFNIFSLFKKTKAYKNNIGCNAKFYFHMDLPKFALSVMVLHMLY